MRNATLEQRAQAAQDAGFDGIGLFAGAYLAAIRNGATDDSLDELFNRCEIGVLELEALPMFRDDLLDLFVNLASRFDVRRVQTIAPFEGAVDRTAAAAWLADAADRFAASDTSLAIEFLPFTAIATARDASELIERTRRDNVGMCVDAWHVFRGGGLDSLVAFAPEHVLSVQLDDGPLQPVLDNYIDDCLHHREVMGAGEFDLVGMMAMLPKGVPLSIEVADDDLDLLAPTDVAQQLAEATRHLIHASPT